MSEAVAPQPVSLPRINDPAPDFEQVSTHGTTKMSSFKGKWVIMFSHPADFTPVCTTEFVGFASNQDEFAKRNVQLIGLSIDSVYSHIAWTRDMKEHFGVDVKFPVLADLDQKVAKLYGLLHPGESSTATVRAVFIIDPEQKIRAIIYYPLTTGRSVAEVIRVIDALQTTDKNGVATPEGWTPGQQVIVPPPTTADAAEARKKESGIDVTDWYFSKKNI